MDEIQFGDDKERVNNQEKEGMILNSISVTYDCDLESKADAAVENCPKNPPNGNDIVAFEHLCYYRILQKSAVQSLHAQRKIVRQTPQWRAITSRTFDGHLWHGKIIPPHASVARSASPVMKKRIITKVPYIVERIRDIDEQIYRSRRVYSKTTEPTN
ncbi:hypothetical protein KIN20_010118 [Parelaphostrongylus tenuis]|uniref:Uncharacterized protein n=1 Tax=Parelaphostrongylus tenuis TaxID=148309 RepID=A0AAD5MTH4_PARTN|nr:hypothetical protein KIN20_010118 [Parelaphostrongylus tenuis]